MTTKKYFIELGEWQLNAFKQRDKYKHALEEIRSYCEEQNLKADYTACEILSIIDKVLDEN